MICPYVCRWWFWTTWLALVLYSVLKWRVCLVFSAERCALHTLLSHAEREKTLLRSSENAMGAVVLCSATLENIHHIWWVFLFFNFFRVFFTVWVFFCIYWPITALSSTSYCWTVWVVIHLPNFLVVQC